MSLSSSDGVAVCGPPPAASCSTPSLGRPIIALLALLFLRFAVIEVLGEVLGLKPWRKD